MKIELQKWALIAEVLGGLAVVITLIFLVLETRANTNAIQTQTYHALTSELNVVRQQLASEEIADFYTQYAESGLETLSKRGAFSLLMLAEAKWGVYETAFYAREREVLGADEWVRYEIAICRNYAVDLGMWGSNTAGLQQTYGGISANATPKFKDYVEQQCAG